MSNEQISESNKMYSTAYVMCAEEAKANLDLIMDNQRNLIQQGQVLESQGKDIKQLYKYHYETNDKITKLENKK